MKFAFDTIDITPKQSHMMSGYEGIRYSKGSRDTLKARILVLDDWVFVSCDLVGLGSEFLDLLRSYLPDFKVDVSASHTHAGPSGTINTNQELHFMHNVFQKWDQDYVLDIIDRIVYAVEGMKYAPVNISTGHIIIKELYGNRTQKGQAFDDECIVFEFESLGKVFALVQLALHPTYYKEDNQLYSKDVFNYIEEGLLDKYEGVIFVQGALGDVSTRFVRDKYSIEEIGDGISDLIKDIEMVPLDPLSYSRSEQKYSFETRFGQVVDLRLVGCSIGNYKFLGLPFEVCSPLKDKVLKEHGVRLLSLHNGYLAYLAPKQYFNISTYESQMTLMQEGQAEKMLKEIDYEII